MKLKQSSKFRLEPLCSFFSIL